MNPIKIISWIIILSRIGKSKRRAIYMKALALSSTAERMGLCFALNKASNYKSDPKVYESMAINYPEVYIHKPLKNECGVYWFKFDDDGIKKRIDILMRATRLTE